MRLCVFSDIHGNALAFRAMLESTRTEGIEGYVFCGDIMGYFYDAAEIIKELKRLTNLKAVMGNHDSYYLNALGNLDLLEALSIRYGKSYLKGIDAGCREFLSSLPLISDFSTGGLRMRAVHGSPRNALEDRLYPDSSVAGLQDIEDYDVLFLGHTHYKMEKRVGDTLVINPGSLGQPRDGKGFSYCVFDCESRSVEFRNVSIDVSMLIEQMNSLSENKAVQEYLKKGLAE